MQWYAWRQPQHNNVLQLTGYFRYLRLRVSDGSLAARTCGRLASLLLCANLVVYLVWWITLWNFYRRYFTSVGRPWRERCGEAVGLDVDTPRELAYELRHWGVICQLFHAIRAGQLRTHAPDSAGYLSRTFCHAGYRGGREFATQLDALWCCPKRIYWALGSFSIHRHPGVAWLQWSTPQWGRGVRARIWSHSRPSLAQVCRASSRFQSDSEELLARHQPIGSVRGSPGAVDALLPPTWRCHVALFGVLTTHCVRWALARTAHLFVAQAMVDQANAEFDDSLGISDTRLSAALTSNCMCSAKALPPTPESVASHPLCGGVGGVEKFGLHLSAWVRLWLADGGAGDPRVEASGTPVDGVSPTVQLAERVATAFARTVKLGISLERNLRQSPTGWSITSVGAECVLLPCAEGGLCPSPLGPLAVFLEVEVRRFCLHLGPILQPSQAKPGEEHLNCEVRCHHAVWPVSRTAVVIGGNEKNTTCLMNVVEQGEKKWNNASWPDLEKIFKLFQKIGMMWPWQDKEFVGNKIPKRDRTLKLVKKRPLRRWRRSQRNETRRKTSSALMHCIQCTEAFWYI